MLAGKQGRKGPEFKESRIIQTRIRKSDKGKTENTDIRATECAADEGVRLCGRETKETCKNKRKQTTTVPAMLRETPTPKEHWRQRRRKNITNTASSMPTLFVAGKISMDKTERFGEKQRQENKGKNTKKLEGSSGCVFEIGGFEHQRISRMSVACLDV